MARIAPAAAAWMLPLACLLLLLAAGIAEIEGRRDGRRPTRDDNRCARMPDECCRKFQWRMLTDPEGWEDSTGCKVKCCQKMAQNRSCKRASALRRAVMRGPVQDLASCIARLIENLSTLNTDLPKICCKVPFVSLLPACA